MKLYKSIKKNQDYENKLNKNRKIQLLCCGWNSNNFKFCVMIELEEILINKIANNLCLKLNDLIIEGLKLKGFEFKDKLELESFIKLNCSCEDNINFKQRIYFVKKIPFFLHNYEPIYEPIKEFNNQITMSANLGTYKFL